MIEVNPKSFCLTFGVHLRLAAFSNSIYLVLFCIDISQLRVSIAITKIYR